MILHKKGLPSLSYCSEYKLGLGCSTNSHFSTSVVKKVTNDIWVKYFWAWAKLSRVNAKKYPIGEICQREARVFTKQTEWVDNCKNLTDCKDLTNSTSVQDAQFWHTQRDTSLGLALIFTGRYMETRPGMGSEMESPVLGDSVAGIPPRGGLPPWELCTRGY